nr:hypothetical protein [uncultured Nocardioides sp.]
MFNNAVVWLDRYPDVRASEIRAIETQTHHAFPDALINDPSLCVRLVKRLTLVAVERDAPAAVLTDLVRLLERMQTGPAAEGLLDYTTHALKALQGMRDGPEIEPVVMHALQGAPDAINKAKLERILELVHQFERSGEPYGEAAVDDPTVLKLDPYTCAAACAVACAEFLRAPACYIPCIYFCIQI